MFVPFKRIASTFGRPSRPYRPAVSGVEAREAVGWALGVVACRTPWDSSCLVQAIAAQRMLARRDIRGTLFLGVKKGSGTPALLHAHAWVACDGGLVVGERGHQSFVVVSSFEWPSSRANCLGSHTLG